MQPLESVVNSAQRVQRLIVEHITNVMRLLRIVPQRIAALDDQRVEILRRPSEDVHGERVTFRRVLHLAERINRVVKYVVCAAHTAVGVCQRNAELLKGGFCIPGSVDGILHIVGQLGQRALQRVHGDVHKLRCVGKLLQLFCGLARRLRHCKNVVNIGGRLLRHGDQRLFGLDHRSDHKAKAGHSQSCACMDAVERFHGLLCALRKLDAKFPGHIRQRVAKAAHGLAVAGELFLEIGKQTLDAAALFLGVGKGFFQLAKSVRRAVCFSLGFLERVLVVLQCTLHFDQFGLCVVELRFPAIGALIGFAVGGGRGLERLFDLLDFFLLRQDRAVEDVIFLGQRFDAVRVIPKLLGREIQLGFQNVQAALDLGQRSLVFPLAVQFDF